MHFPRFFFCYLVLKSTYETGFGRTTFLLQRPILQLHFLRRSSNADSKLPQADTKHFNLYLRTADFYAIHETMDYGTIFKFLQGMTKLESMRIRSACCDIDTPFYKAFGKIITWPNLTQLSIQSLHSCEFSDLAAVIQLHKAILRRLTLYNIDYDDESRCNIRADLRAGAMDKIRIWNLQRRVGEARDLIDSGPPLLFSDGAWSPRLGSYLRGEVVAKLFPSFAHAQKGLLAEDDERT